MRKLLGLVALTIISVSGQAAIESNKLECVVRAQFNIKFAGEPIVERRYVFSSKEEVKTIIRLADFDSSMNGELNFKMHPSVYGDAVDENGKIVDSHVALTTIDFQSQQSGEISSTNNMFQFSLKNKNHFVGGANLHIGQGARANGSGKRVWASITCGIVNR